MESIYVYGQNEEVKDLRSSKITRLYFQVAPGEDVNRWSDLQHRQRVEITTLFVVDEPDASPVPR